jgi:hypothetical protein
MVLTPYAFVKGEYELWYHCLWLLEQMIATPKETLWLPDHLPDLNGYSGLPLAFLPYLQSSYRETVSYRHGQLSGIWYCINWHSACLLMP